jgi:hypothetical protein
MVEKIEKEHGNLSGWRKTSYWHRGLKSLMRSLGRASNSGGKNKEERVKAAASYVQNLLNQKSYNPVRFLCRQAQNVGRI